MSALVSTVAEARRIYANIRRSFLYLLAFHVPIVSLAVVVPIAGLPLLLQPVHLVWLEFIVHPVSALNGLADRMDRLRTGMGSKRPHVRCWRAGLDERSFTAGDIVP